MSDFLMRPVLAWYDWAVFVLLFVDVDMAALVVYDSRSRRRPALGWIAAMVLSGLGLLPAIALILHYPDLDPLILAFGVEGVFSAARDLELARQLVNYAFLGLLGGLLPVAAGALYLFTIPRPLALGREVGATCLPERQEIRPPEEGAPSRGKPRISVWLAESGTGLSYQPFQDDTRIGRSPATNDVVFSDPTVSREHASIRYKRETFTLFDRGSRTDIFVGDQRMGRPAILAHGDVIVLGKVSLTFTALE